MSVTREYGESLARLFRDELLQHIEGVLRVDVLLTGSLAVCDEGNDADVLTFVDPDHLDATLEYMAAHFQHCGADGSYVPSDSRSVWRRGELNVILAHTEREYTAWFTALNLMRIIRQKTGVAPDRELRVMLHEVSRGEHLEVSRGEHLEVFIL